MLLTKRKISAIIHRVGTVCAGVAELVDARDLKSRGTKLPYRFKPGFRHQSNIAG